VPSTSMRLINSIITPTAGEPELLAYLEARAFDASQRGEYWQIAPATYLAGHAPSLARAREWWPTDAPVGMTWGESLLVALNEYGDPTGAPDVLAALTARTVPVVAWLEHNGRSTEHPNETRAQRAARKNRERQRRHRDGHRPEADPRAAQVGAAWSAYIDACRERRESDAAHAARCAQLKAAHAALLREPSGAPVAD